MKFLTMNRMMKKRREVIKFETRGTQRRKERHLEKKLARGRARMGDRVSDAGVLRNADPCASKASKSKSHPSQSPPNLQVEFKNHASPSSWGIMNHQLTCNLATNLLTCKARPFPAISMITNSMLWGTRHGDISPPPLPSHRPSRRS